jgi:hypothetical protein
LPLLTTAHDSGFWPLAKPYQIKGFHLQSSADLPRRTACPCCLIKTIAFFFIMLPTKIDLQGAISPFTWGFELKTWHVIVHTISTLILALLSVDVGAYKLIYWYCYWFFFCTSV